jgi:hypothetical protein
MAEVFKIFKPKKNFLLRNDSQLSETSLINTKNLSETLLLFNIFSSVVHRDSRPVQG